ncbi:elongation of very long chain fatty acids protein 4-like [Ixodes scapularis]|uniref:elongation of very long chain fatty acids protein 4-like n=1 Tax=Ixodes scapularis TaxID=6945 RepID=UPI001C393930|nr:elongation of very long chain fatty acids protein 4-like [Ixodes scapularis]
MDLFHEAVGIAVRNADPRVKKWTLMGSPVPVGTLIVLYVCFSKIWGPNLMRLRKPFAILPLIRAHNACMVVFNVIFIVTFSKLSYSGGGYNYFCQGPDYTSRGLPVLKMAWWYLLVKILDLTDTLAFVLTKKFDHVSTLHVFHHSAVVGTMWVTVNYGVLGQNVFVIILNSYVHVVMYSYYFLTTLGPMVRPHLWWKKYLTQLQMAQLAAFVLHGSIPLFVDCGFPLWMALLTVTEPVVLLVMFYKFYLKSYRQKSHIATGKIAKDEAHFVCSYRPYEDPLKTRTK